jgi:hypothetical protein
VARNEHGDEIPSEVIKLFEETIVKELGLKLVPKYESYIYIIDRYGNWVSAGKYAREYPASITGGNGSKRFRSKQSYEANKIVKEHAGIKYVVFPSPTYGGVNIFSDYVPYKH